MRKLIFAAGVALAAIAAPAHADSSLISGLAGRLSALNGYVQGSGSGALTASPTIPCASALAGAVCTVPNNAELLALSTATLPANTIVHRAGYASAGDGGDMDYLASGSACSLASGNGDNGSQVKSANGKCWTWKPKAGGVALEVFGGDTTAANDNTAFTNAIAALQAQTNGEHVLLLGARTYNVSQSITVNGPSPVAFRGQGMGATTIQASATSNYSVFSYGNTAATSSQTQFGGIYGMTIKAGASATAGYAISAVHVANFTVRDIAFTAYCGIEDEQSNNDLYDNVWGYTTGTGCQAFWAHVTSAAQSAGGRTDQVTLNNVHLNAQYYGNDCLTWTGMVQTINAYNVTLMQCKRGFFVDASQNTASLFPQFGFVYNLQVEGAQVAAVEIDGGRDIHFTDSAAFSDYGQTGAGGTQGNADTAALWIKPDGAASVTSTIDWKGGTIGNSANQAALVQAQGVRFSDVAFRNSSLASQYAKPSVELQGAGGYASQDYQFSNVKFCAIYGETPAVSYGLVRDANVGITIVTNADFQYCHTGEVSDASSSLNLAVYGGIDRNQVALPVSLGKFHSNAQPTFGACGTSPSIGTGYSNDVAGVVNTGTGTFSSCTVNFASTWGNPPIVFLQGTGSVPYYITGQSATSFTFARTDGGNMASLTVYYRATMGGN